MQALPVPVPVGGNRLDSLLRRFLNLASDADWTLLKAWLVAALRPSGPYPLVCIQGEQGSAKSTTARLLKKLTDPSAAALRAAPRDERDLAVAAKNSRVLCFDNLSSILPWFSDAFCRLANHGGLALRKNYSDDDEQIFDGARPIILTGIEDLAQRGDLADRSIDLHLCRPEKYRDEKEYWSEFDEAYPRILGALLDCVSGAMRALKSVKLEGKHRMADFAKWAVAAEMGAGGTGEEFLTAYSSNQAQANENVLEDDACIAALRKWVDEAPGPIEDESIEDKLPGWDGCEWSGTATQLKKILDKRAGEAATKDKKWPKLAHTLSNKLTRFAPNLRAAGIDVKKGQAPGGKRTRFISIKRLTQMSVPERTERTETHKTVQAAGTLGDAQENFRDAQPLFAESPENQAVGTAGTLRDADLHPSKM